MARASQAMPDDDGPIFDIADATRAGMHLLIELFGPSQCGKTLTGLLLARGIAGPNGTVGVMDTEGRARMFYDKIPGGFKVGELTRPFSPRRYLDGIELFMRYGVDVLMIDSFSHVWEGLGGVLDQAESSGLKGLAKWNKPKRDYNRMVSALLTTRIPLIFCSRAKQPMKVEQVVKNGRETEEWTPQPWEPIQDKRLKFDMTVVASMTLDGFYETTPERLKCPDDLRHLFNGEQLTIETGALIGKWIAGGELINHAHELLRKQAFDAAALGAASLRHFYDGLDDPQRLVLRPTIANLRSAAKAADEDAEQQRQAREELASRGEQDDALADPFGRSDIRGEELLPPIEVAKRTGAASNSSYALRNQAFWSQQKLVIQARDADEFYQLMKRYLGEARDVFDVNGLEMDNAAAIDERFGGAVRSELAEAIAARRAELQAT